MSEVKLNVTDERRTINGTVHGSVADAVIASLSAEPETISELELAFGRFSKSDRTPFLSFRSGEDDRPWDAGVVIVDLAARVIASESSYNEPTAQGEIAYHDGYCATDVRLPYRIPDDWLIFSSLPEYESARGERRNERLRKPPIDIRYVLYRKPMFEFIANEYSANLKKLGRAHSEVSSQTEGFSKHKSEESDDENGDLALLQKLHIDWLMTPRADLGNRSPRDVILEKLSFIDFDLQSRELQWSMLNEGPPPLQRTSQAYLRGGFGTNEYVIYYDYVRYLLRQCWERINGSRSSENNDASSKHWKEVDAWSDQEGKLIENPSLREDRADKIADWLQKVGDAWLNSPRKEFNGRIPNEIIESERRRIPLLFSVKDVLSDDCPLCQMLAEDTDIQSDLGFWHLDGSPMDHLFEFSTYRTREEWESDERRWEQYNEEFARRWSKDHQSVEEGGSDGDDYIPF
jgi:hypothetical protein